MLLNIIFSMHFCFFKDFSDKANADDDFILYDDVIFNILRW